MLSADLGCGFQFYDPRVWVREGEKTLSERVKVACKDLGNHGMWHALTNSVLATNQSPKISFNRKGVGRLYGARWSNLDLHWVHAEAKGMRSKGKPKFCYV